jgi:hypothetical protein
MTLDIGISLSQAAVVYAEPGDSLYTDIGAYASTIEPGAQERASGEAYVFGSDIAILTTGKRGLIDLTLSMIYTEDPTDFFEVCRLAFENSSDVCFAYSPKGGNVTNATPGDETTDVAEADRWYYIDAARVLSYTPPNGDASSGNPLMASVTIRTNAIVPIEDDTTSQPAVPKTAAGQSGVGYRTPPAAS